MSSPVVPNIGPYNNSDFYFQTLDLIYWLSGGGGGGITPADITAAINASDIFTQASANDIFLGNQNSVFLGTSSGTGLADIIFEGLIGSWSTAPSTRPFLREGLFNLDDPNEPDPYLHTVIAQLGSVIEGLWDNSDSLNPKKLLVETNAAGDWVGESVGDMTGNQLSLMAYGRQRNSIPFKAYVSASPESTTVIFDPAVTPGTLYITHIKYMLFRDSGTAVNFANAEIGDQSDDGFVSACGVIPPTATDPVQTTNVVQSYTYPIACTGKVQIAWGTDVNVASAVEVRGYYL